MCIPNYRTLDNEIPAPLRKDQSNDTSIGVVAPSFFTLVLVVGSGQWRTQLNGVRCLTLCFAYSFSVLFHPSRWRCLICLLLPLLLLLLLFVLLVLLLLLLLLLLLILLYPPLPHLKSPMTTLPPSDTRQLNPQGALVSHDPATPIYIRQLNPQGVLVSPDPSLPVRI